MHVHSHPPLDHHRAQVYEKNHVLVLGWAKSQLDLSVLYKILQELCLAYRCGSFDLFTCHNSILYFSIINYS